MGGLFNLRALERFPDTFPRAGNCNAQVGASSARRGSSADTPIQGCITRTPELTFRFTMAVVFAWSSERIEPGEFEKGRKKRKKKVRMLASVDDGAGPSTRFSRVVAILDGKRAKRPSRECGAASNR